MRDASKKSFMSELDLNSRIKKFLNSALKGISTKDYDNAIEDLKAAEILDKDNAEILYNLGICYCKKGLYKTAISYFRKLQNLSYTFVDVITVKKMLAYALIMTEDYKQAKKHINEGLKLSANDTTLLNMLGYALEKDMKYDEASNAYREIIEIDKNNYNACNSLAYIIALSGGDLNEAQSYAKKALKARPLNPAYLDTMGFILMKKGQKDTAKEFFKKALHKMPDSAAIKGHINELLKI